MTPVHVVSGPSWRSGNTGIRASVPDFFPVRGPPSWILGGGSGWRSSLTDSKSTPASVDLQRLRRLDLGWAPFKSPTTTVIVFSESLSHPLFACLTPSPTFPLLSSGHPGCSPLYVCLNIPPTSRPQPVLLSLQQLIFFKSLSLYFRWSFYPIALDCSTLVIQLRLYLPPHSLSPSLHFLTSRYHAASCSLSSSTPPCSSGPLYISAAIPASPPLFSPCVVRYCREEVGGLRGWGAEEAYEMS